MADTVTETTTTPEVTAKDLKEKKECVEEVEKENGSGETPANGNGATNGDAHQDEAPENKEEEKDKEEAGEEAKNGAEETDGHPVKRPAEEEESVDIKKQKTENGDSTEAEVEA